MKPSERSGIPAFQVMEVMRAAAEREAAGLEVLHLEVGQPSTSAPSKVLAAAHRALDSDRLGYTAALGLPGLRERVAGWYDQRYGVDIDPARVVITTGASGSCVLGFMAGFDPGQRVGVLEPGYPCYRNDLMALGVEVVRIPVGVDTNFRPTTEQLDQHGPLDGLILAGPGNPTGTVFHEPDLRRLVDWSQANDVVVFSDEIYHGITYDQPAPTVLSFTDQAVVFNSFSKYFSMTGWRLGWIIAPEPLLSALERLAQNFTIAPPTLSQLAAMEAFCCVDELDENVARYAINRRLLLDGLHAAGITVNAPADGAFFVWSNVAHLGEDSQQIARRWLDECGVAATPGIDFDLEQGHEWMRFSYAGTAEEMTEATTRLARWKP